jgi:hypothetical protein
MKDKTKKGDRIMTNREIKIVTDSINTLAKKAEKNLPDAFRRMEDPEYSKKKSSEYRDRLAVRLREAKNRVKENKTRNNGVYIPGK